MLIGVVDYINELDRVTKASDTSKPYGDVKYADPGYQSDGKARYPIDTEAHIRAAWNYINKEADASKYTAQQLSAIKRRIVAAWKDKIDPAGPPSAQKVEHFSNERALGSF